MTMPITRLRRKPGPKPSITKWIRYAYVRKFELTPKNAQRLDAKFLRQLALCKDEESQRLLLYGFTGERTKEKRPVDQNRFRSLAWPGEIPKFRR